MQTQLLKEIIFCTNDTISDRIALMKPVLISFAISVLVVGGVGKIYSYAVPLTELVIIFVSMLVTYGLVQKIKKNPIIFISPFTMITLSVIGMIQNPTSNQWLIFQILSMIVINVLGSTRCNVVNFVLVVTGPLIASAYGSDLHSLYGTQIILWAIFPALLYSSYYRTLLAIDKLNNLKTMHNLEIQVVNKDKNTQLAQISSLIAHEVNNALTILSGNLHLIRKKYPDAGSMIDKAEKNSNRIQEIVSLIKRKSYSNSTKKEFNLSDSVKDEVYFIDIASQKAGIAFNVEEVQNDIYISANETEIIQVLSNLISNAKDAFTDCSRTDEKQIKIALYKENQHAVLAVEDNGCGIPVKNLNSIFQEGFTTKSKGSGTGLGLFFIKKIIEKNQGDIKVSSSDVGSRFEVSLPCLNKLMDD